MSNWTWGTAALQGPAGLSVCSAACAAPYPSLGNTDSFTCAFPLNFNDRFLYGNQVISLEDISDRLWILRSSAKPVVSPCKSADVQFLRIWVPAG